MKKELDDKLCKDFPFIMQDRNMPRRDSMMAYGFPGDGWFDLIYTLCTELTSIRKQSGLRVVFHQVKQKMGLLRIYHIIDRAACKCSSSQRLIWEAKIYDLVHNAEENSSVICEKCGKPGFNRSKGFGSYINKTLCEECHE